MPASWFLSTRFMNMTDAEGDAVAVCDLDAASFPLEIEAGGFVGPDFVVLNSHIWSADILIAASQDVEAHADILTVSPDGCGIILIDQSRGIQRVDQGRVIERGGKYKTRNNTVHQNEVTFEGSGCAGGASDARPGDENFTLISDGNNRFHANVYHVPHARGRDRFVWGHSTPDWDGLRN